MLMRSHSERRALPGFSALLTYSTPKLKDVTTPPLLTRTPRDSIFTPVSLTSPPPWVTQALSNLEQGEQELLNLRERQQAEVEKVNRELDSAAIEAQREERRLLEKVEQEHREAQRHLSQVKRENAAAVRVVQSLIDQQLRKMSQLKEQIQRWGITAGESNKNQLQRGVAEVTQPWELSLTLKRVSFVPNPKSESLSLGEIDIRDQGMTYPIGVCSVQGQKCALHSGNLHFLNISPLEIRKEPQLNRSGQRCSPEESSKTNSGNMRVVRKLRLSSSTDNEEDFKSLISPISRHRGVSESSQDEEAESVFSDSQGQDLFLAIPPVSSQGESEGDDSDSKPKGTKKGKRKQKTLVLVSCKEPSCPPEEISEKKSDAAISSNVHKGSLSSQSLVDVSTGYLSLSQQGLSNKSSVDSGSPPSPVNSEDFCYTYTVNTPVNESLKQEHYRSVSTAELCGKLQPLISDDKTEHGQIRKVNKMCLVSESSTLGQGHGSDLESERNTINCGERQSRAKTRGAQGLSLNQVSRSLSMSTIEGDKSYKVNETQQDMKKGAVSGLRELEEEDGSTALDSAYLVKQFGKQGSGRTDFNLPSGVHATAKGQLFVVDCGNARIQVTDLQKNVVQQVSPSGSERSSRVCNYFDVAVNSKGLIALTCAAERAVLVFSRHGRLLQTFGGTMIGSTNEELDAPRGVTVNRQDEFLVADIKRGSLTALKLDPKTGARLERTVVTGYHRPYLVAACLTNGLMAVSERGNETGRVPCIRVLEPGWNTIRILGVCSGLGPVLTCPWGLCIDSDGDVLVTDWGKQLHRVLIYPSKGVGWPLVSDNLSSPRGLALLPEGQVVVSDSMNHCIKIYQYK